MLAKQEGRARRKRRIRKKISGTAERPRLTVFRSLTNIYCQLVDDDEGRTLHSSSTVALRKAGTQFKSGGNKDAATAIGKDIAEKAKAAGVTQVVFDRGPYKFHGRVQALADAAREGGLKF